jgi:hypothetical protein
MDPKELADRLELLRIGKQKLAKLEQQALKLGALCPPYILIEIDETKQKIQEIEEILVNDEKAMENQVSPASSVSTILFLAADPSDISRLRLGEELREIQEKLRMAKMRDQFNLEQRMSVRPVDIAQAILDENPRIVHFSGHGTNIGELCFENEQGVAQTVHSDALAALFELVADRVDCVILNACFSEIQAKAISTHINYVIGMNKEIGDNAAISFAVGFYQALGAGETIEKAYKFGCVQIRLQGIPEHLTPVLIKKEQTQL